MARVYSEIQNVIEQMLQDTTPTYYDTTETGYWIEEGLKEFSQYDPHIVDVVFQIESRTGTDTAGTSGSLTDTTKSQFLSTDATSEKVVHNTTDHTWAVIKTDSSTSVQVLTVAIMASGENYEMYNKRCVNKKQIYIGDMPPYLWVESVEYPIGTRRNFRVYDDVLEIGVDSVADSDSTATIKPDVDVLVRFALPHILSQLTDWEGALTAAESKDDTSIDIGSMGSTEIIEVGEEFHLADHRTLYFITTEVTTSANAATISFYPPLEADEASTSVITFRKSSLQPQHEEILCHLVAARAAISKGAKPIQQIETAITTLADVNSAIDNMSARVTQTIADIASGRAELAKTPAIVTSAATAIGKIDAEVTQAVADLDAGRIEVAKVSAIIGTSMAALGKVDAEVTQAITDLDAGRTEAAKVSAIITLAESDIALVHSQIAPAVAQFHAGQPLINEINKGGVGVPTTYANYATTALNNANAYINEAQAHFSQATRDESIARTYESIARTGLANANAYIGEARAYLNQATADESLMRSYMGQAQGVLASARGYLNEAQGYFAQATKDESIARTYASTGSAELNTAAAQLNQAGGYIREITSRLNVASSWTQYQGWGERKLDDVLGKLERLRKPITKHTWPRD